MGGIARNLTVGAGVAVVATAAALIARPGSPNQPLEYASDKKAWFHADPLTTLPYLNSVANLSTAMPGGGVRTRMRGWGNEYWRQQFNFYVDPSAGSDSNTCLDVSHPCLTVQEIKARIGDHLVESPAIWLLADLPVTDPLSVLNFIADPDPVNNGANSSLYVICKGVSSFSSTTTAGSAVPVPASNVASKLVDTTVANWTTHVGKRWTTDVTLANWFTSSNAWILKDTGSNSARVSRFALATSDVQSAPTTTPYNLMTLGKVTGASNVNGLPTLVGAGGYNLPAVAIVNCDFSNTGLSIHRNGATAYLFQGDKFAAVTNYGANVEFDTSYMGGAYTASNPDAVQTFKSCAGPGAITLSGGAKATFSDYVSQAGAVLVQTNATADTTNLSVFDVSGTGLSVQTGAFLTVATALYGSGSTIGVTVLNGGRFDTVPTPTLTGTTELQFDGAGTAIPPLTAGASVPAAAALTTFAGLAGGSFGGKVQGNATGSWMRDR